ncbi:glycosyltransferase family 4 protein [Jiella sp. MQZ9-1]|uniref:Glycosyltransferase family 4 protein n=1 Tax=Jiella flava TaxID=2816857 RepID=A0A939FYF9_9HYPH|nr:glycosyltransferase family 4 protein [Jiella flava]MBO0663046.1 glycosyltransferase family 4 protein [Jiella flava]MCD2471465.1 glycosyltransferase family 4 protein [Jiella flava]
MNLSSKISAASAGDGEAWPTDWAELETEPGAPPVSAHRAKRVCFPYVGDEVGGSHISSLKLIRNLDRRDVEPLIVLHRIDGPLAPFLTKEGFRFIHLPLPALLAPHRLSLPQLMTFARKSLPLMRSFLREGRIAIVHTNDGRIHASWGLAARLARKRVVWHHRGDPDAKGANLLAPLLADRIVTVSKFSQPRRPLFPVRKRLAVIHSPFDHPATRPDRETARRTLLAELDLPEATRILGYFGALIDRKRPLLFVDIVARLKRARPDLPIVGCLFGAPVESNLAIEHQIRQRIAALDVDVRLMGFRRPVEPAMAATDVLLVPAVSEPFGRTLIEAMLLETPVVATDHGGNPEAIRDGETGFLVAPEDPDAFVEPVAQLLTDPALAEAITERARSQALRHYGVACHVDEIMRIYRKLTPDERGGSAAPARSASAKASF